MDAFRQPIDWGFKEIIQMLLYKPLKFEFKKTIVSFDLQRDM